MHLDEHVPDAFVLVYSGHEESRPQTPPVAMYLWNSRTRATGTDGFLSWGGHGSERWAGSSISRSGGLRATSSSGFWSSSSWASSTTGTSPSKRPGCSSSSSPSSGRCFTLDGWSEDNGPDGRLRKRVAAAKHLLLDTGR